MEWRSTGCSTPGLAAAAAVRSRRPAAMLLADMMSVIAEGSSRRSISSMKGRRSRGMRRPIFSSLQFSDSVPVQGKIRRPTVVLSESMLCLCRIAVSRYCLTTSL